MPTMLQKGIVVRNDDDMNFCSQLECNNHEERQHEEEIQSVGDKEKIGQPHQQGKEVVLQLQPGSTDNITTVAASKQPSGTPMVLGDDDHMKSSPHQQVAVQLKPLNATVSQELPCVGGQRKDVDDDDSVSEKQQEPLVGETKIHGDNNNSDDNFSSRVDNDNDAPVRSIKHEKDDVVIIDSDDDDDNNNNNNDDDGNKNVNDKNPSTQLMTKRKRTDDLNDAAAQVNGNDGEDDNNDDNGNGWVEGDASTLGFDPAVWRLRTIRTKLRAPLGLCILQRGEVTRLKIGGQGDRLGIKVGSKLISLNGEPIKVAGLGSKLDGTEKTLVLAEPRQFAKSVVMHARDGWLEFMDRANIREECYKRAMYVLTEYDKWIEVTDTNEPTPGNPIVDEISNLMFQHLCSEIIIPPTNGGGMKHYKYVNNEYNYGSNYSHWGVPSWMVCDGRFRFVGPQPWMVTRRLALFCIQQLYNKTRYDLRRWQEVHFRSKWLAESIQRKIRNHLKTIGVLKPGQSSVQAIRQAFLHDNAQSCSWYRLTEYYVATCYERWIGAGSSDKSYTILTGIQYWSSCPCQLDPSLEKAFGNHMDKLQYAKFPFVKDWNLVKRQAWRAYCCKFKRSPTSISLVDVTDWLEDLEEGMGFLTISNQSLSVRFKSSALSTTQLSLSSPSPLLLPQVQPQPHLITESDSINSHIVVQRKIDEDHSLSSSESQDAGIILRSNSTSDGDQDTQGSVNGDDNSADTGPFDEVADSSHGVVGSKSAMVKSLARHGKKKTKKSQIPSDQRIEGDVNSAKQINFPKRPTPLSIATRVYCRWPENDSWYWGHIVGIIPIKKRSFKYKVRFDDGDFLEKVPEKDICTKEEYDMTELSKKTIEDDVSGEETDVAEGHLTLHQLFHSRCSKCVLCRRKACGRCFPCRYQRKPEEVCLQKMCGNIPLSRKAQPAPWLGDGFKFAFVDPDSSEPETQPRLKQPAANWKGLVVITPTGSEIRDAVNVVRQQWSTENANIFFYQIGFDAMFLDLSSMGRSTAMTPRELYENRCNSCSNCLKNDCSRCSCCLANASAAKSSRQCCLQKMCCMIALEKKAQPARSFPGGWTFVFDLTEGRANPQYKGLSIMAPNGTEFSSVEAAIAQNSTSLADVDPVQFYSYVGLNCEGNSLSSDESGELDNAVTLDSDSGALAPLQHGSGSIHSIAGKSITKADLSGSGESDCEEDIVGLSARELFKRACHSCSMCQKVDCGACHTCIRNLTYTRRYKEVCLRKMCRVIPLHQKAQKARGLPPGWKFAFCDPSELRPKKRRDYADSAGMQGLCVFRTLNHLHRSVRVALRQSKQPAEDFEIFCKHIGVSVWRKDTHALVGKGFCRQWTDVLGRPRILHGFISKCETNIVDKDHQQFTVTYTYNQDAPILSNETDNVCNLVTPEQETVSSKWAWGGFYQDRAKAFHTIIPSEPPSPYWTWSIPDQRHESLVESMNGSKTPQLTLYFRRFMIVLFVEPSTIPNAGNGVFVKCTPLTPPGERPPLHFELEPGQFLDLGVYAPFRPEDRKGMHIVILKNFIHSLYCEEWSFDTFDDDFQYDITDDVSGDLHELAKKHIPAYVNECCADQVPTVHAWHDPEGSVHYLLGHEEESNGTLRLPADGVTKTEIFVDYGSRYEYVRIRKGYSRLSLEERLPKIQQMERDEAEYVREINTFSCSELKDAKEFFSHVFQYDEAFVRNESRERALCVAILLKARAISIMNEFANLDANNEQFCDNGVTSLNLKDLVEDFGNLVLAVCKQWENPVVMKESLLKKDLFSEVLKEVWQLNDLDRLTPMAFLERVKSGSA